jgi:hypothetical protein
MSLTDNSISYGLEHVATCPNIAVEFLNYMLEINVDQTHFAIQVWYAQFTRNIFMDSFY